MNTQHDTTRTQTHQTARHGPDDPWWSYAQGCAAALSRGEAPPVAATHGPLLQPNEVTRLHAPANYSRLLRGDGDYNQAHSPFFVNPLLMVGAMATQAAVNRRRRHRAEQDTHASWRNHRPVAVLTTNLRLMCSRPDGGYISFWYQDLAEFYPQTQARNLTMSFEDDHTPPLQLSGPAVPAISLWAGHALYGDAWQEHPHLAALIPTEQHRNSPDHAVEHHHQHATAELTDEQRQWLTQQQHHRRHTHRSADEPGLSR